jgi:hypothetical protein
MVKVTPAVGPPYYLVDHQGDGNFVQRGSDTIGPMTSRRCGSSFLVNRLSVYTTVGRAELAAWLEPLGAWGAFR